MAHREPQPGEVFSIPVTTGVVAAVMQGRAGVSQVFEPMAAPDGAPGLEALVSQPIAAEILIANHAFAGLTGWPAIGTCQLPEGDLQREVRFVRYDAVADKFFLIGPSLGIEWFSHPQEISIEEAAHLEDAAVWEQVHVERCLLARWEGREEGFLSTRLRPWQARPRRDAILSGAMETRPVGGRILESRPEWG